MQGYTIPTVTRRSVLIRPIDEGAAVQLGIVSVYGNIIESVGLDSAQVPGLIGALTGAQEAADLDLMAALKCREVEMSERHKAALARNPWLQPDREERGLR